MPLRLDWTSFRGVDGFSWKFSLKETDTSCFQLKVSEKSLLIIKLVWHFYFPKVHSCFESEEIFTTPLFLSQPSYDPFQLSIYPRSFIYFLISNPSLHFSSLLISLYQLNLISLNSALLMSSSLNPDPVVSDLYSPCYFHFRKTQLLLTAWNLVVWKHDEHLRTLWETEGLPPVSVCWAAFTLTFDPDRPTCPLKHLLTLSSDVRSWWPAFIHPGKDANEERLLAPPPINLRQNKR